MAVWVSTRIPLPPSDPDRSNWARVTPVGAVHEYVPGVANATPLGVVKLRTCAHTSWLV